MIPSLLFAGLVVGWLAAFGWRRAAAIVTVVLLLGWMAAVASGLDSAGDYFASFGLAVVNLAVGAMFAAVFTRLLGRVARPPA